MQYVSINPLSHHLNLLYPEAVRPMDLNTLHILCFCVLSTGRGQQPLLHSALLGAANAIKKKKKNTVPQYQWLVLILSVPGFVLTAQYSV